VKQNVSPVMVIVALVILAIVVAGIWWFTMGKSGKKVGETTFDAASKQPTTPQEAAARGYKQGPGAPGATGGPPAAAGGGK